MMHLPPFPSSADFIEVTTALVDLPSGTRGCTENELRLANRRVTIQLHFGGRGHVVLADIRVSEVG
jgi:hypothetical protein